MSLKWQYGAFLCVLKLWRERQFFFSGFIGGNRPMPLKQAEVDAILATGKAGKAEPLCLQMD